jgi:DNA-binding NarL/FixJ family response regulator
MVRRVSQPPADMMPVIRAVRSAGFPSASDTDNMTACCVDIPCSASHESVQTDYGYTRYCALSFSRCKLFAIIATLVQHRLQQMSPTRTLLIDDHVLFRAGLRMVLNSGIENLQIAEAGSLEEALRDTLEPPTVVLLDLKLQGLNGLEGIALLRRKWPQTAVVVLSSDSASSTVRSALERGAVAFVSKADSADSILTVMRQVLLGEPLTAAQTLSHEMSGKVLTRQLLTPRQCEVLDLLCQGLSNRVIGQRLSLSEHTVRGHVQALLAALQVSSRSEAGYAARRMGLVD